MVLFKSLLLPVLLVVSAATLVSSGLIDAHANVWHRGMTVEDAISKLEQRFMNMARNDQSKSGTSLPPPPVHPVDRAPYSDSS